VRADPEAVKIVAQPRSRLGRLARYSWLERKVTSGNLLSNTP
jgi:hypothetical protein